VREALFSILGPLDGLSVLDLFAGSGALGIEALSRGASRAVFVESDEDACRVIRSNLSALGAEGVVVTRDVVGWLSSPDAASDPFGLVLVDPPYSSGPELADVLSERLPSVAAEGARIVTESQKRSPLHLTLPLHDERSYGRTRIAIHSAG